MERGWNSIHLITTRVGESTVMEAAAYILVLTLMIGVLFFAIAFREPPRIKKD
jgi:photosystem II PsbT protein